MKVSIIGAGRNRNGIGKYIAKYFQKNGATVISVLGTTEQTARRASSALSQFGIKSSSYFEFNTMIARERPDAVVIASPSSTHYEYIIKCIEAGLHVFCEKPFVRQEKRDIRKLLENIFEKAESKNVKIAMNSQWPFSIPFYEKLCGPLQRDKTDTFFISLSPMFCGKEMILESAPHVLSMLYAVFGEGEIANFDIELHGSKTKIKFHYMSDGRKLCAVGISLSRKERQPRSFAFGFNDRIVRRELNLANYDICFNFEGRTLKITDPLELSVQDFICSVRQNREPLIGRPHILSNMCLMKKIYDFCDLV